MFSEENMSARRICLNGLEKAGLPIYNDKGGYFGILQT